MPLSTNLIKIPTIYFVALLKAYIHYLPSPLMKLFLAISTAANPDTPRQHRQTTLKQAPSYRVWRSVYGGHSLFEEFMGVGSFFVRRVYGGHSLSKRALLGYTMVLG
jgi:hypothetical protein